MATDYCLYVVDLDPIVWEKKRRMREANPGYDPASKTCCLYVGLTSRTPEERFALHKAGNRAAAVVRDYGRYLRRRLYKKYPRMTKAEAEVVERELAEALRKRGCAVWPRRRGRRPQPQSIEFARA